MVLLRPCATSAGFTATPDKPRRLDMRRLRDRLKDAGYTVVVDAHVILIVRKDVECSIYSDGKVLLKTTERDAAERAYQDLEPHLG